MDDGMGDIPMVHNRQTSNAGNGKVQAQSQNSTDGSRIKKDGTPEIKSFFYIFFTSLDLKK